jgi:hypothetical protein
MTRGNNSSHFVKLKKKWIAKHQNLSKEVFGSHKQAFQWLSSSSKQLTVGSLAGLFLLTQPIATKVPFAFSQTATGSSQTIDKKAFIVYDLKSVLPSQVEPLTDDKEKEVGEILSRDFGLSVVPKLLGKRLNTTFGYIGQEQHLARFPGDNLYTHFANPNEAKDYFGYGMAPGLGGWNYFAKSNDSLTQKDIDREKYYIAVQTFLAPGFYNDPKGYLDFFKYRKMLVVNPQNGKAIVADIADAGPAVWTGKQLGGSPEVMRYLERSDGASVGGVLYFFIDDPNDTIPLGPINSL